MNQSKIEFRKVRDFGALLNVTFDYIKRNFKILFKSNLFISAPAILLAGVFLGLYQNSIFNFAVSPDLQQFGIPFLFSTFFMMIAYLIVMIVTYSHLMIYKQSETGLFDIDDVWQMTKQNFLVILFTGIGYSLIVGIVALVFIGIGMYMVFQGSYGFVFLVLVGFGIVLYLSINYSLIFIVRIEEGISFSEALTRSKELISQNWWFTFGLIMVVGIIQGFLAYALYIPTYIVMFFVAFTGVNSETGVFARSMFIITSIITSLSILFYMISIVAISFQYYNLVERKEAPGLLEQIENIK